MKNFYYLDESGAVKGPFSSEEMRALNRSEQVSGATQVCEEGTENWIPFHQTAIGLPPRKQGPQRKVHKAKPRRKVQPKSNWLSIKKNWSSIKENWSLVRGWWWSLVRGWSSLNEDLKICGCVIGGILMLIAASVGYSKYLDGRLTENARRQAYYHSLNPSNSGRVAEINSPEYRKSMWSSRTILSVERLGGHFVDEKYQVQQNSVTPMIGVSRGRRIFGAAPTTNQIEKTRKKWIPIQYRVEYRADGGPVKIVTIDYDPSSYAR